MNRGLLRSHLGPGGGYSLARDPKEISFFDVHEAIEGALLVMDCGQGSDVCLQMDSCTQLGVWRQLEEKIQGLFEGVTMEDIKQDVLCTQPAGTLRGNGQIGSD